MLQTSRIRPSRTVLLAYGEEVGGPDWLRDVNAAWGQAGLVLCEARTGPETVRRIEVGGLAAAVVVEDQRTIDGLSLLRIIRSIDVVLPCWLLTHDLRRTTLESALALQVMSVFTRTIAAGELADAVRRRVLGVDTIG